MELESVRAQLHEVKEQNLAMDTTFADTQNSYKASLKELKEKAAMLSNALDKEVEAKADMVDELTKVRGELERVLTEQRDFHSAAIDKEKALTAQLAEFTRDNAVKESDLKNTK